MTPFFIRSVYDVYLLFSDLFNMADNNVPLNELTAQQRQDFFRACFHRLSEVLNTGLSESQVNASFDALVKKLEINPEALADAVTKISKW